MQRLAICCLSDLLTTAKPISDDQGFLVCLTYRWKEHTLTSFERDIVVIFLEAKGPSHTTATRVKHLEIKAELSEDGLFIIHFHDGFVMAVPMHNCLTL